MKKKRAKKEREEGAPLAGPGRASKPFLIL